MIMRRTKKLILSATAVCLVGTMAVTSFAATEHWNDNSAKTAVSKEWKNWKVKWEQEKNDYEKIALSPGENETKMNFAWYSKNDKQAKIRISTSSDLTKTLEKDGANTYLEDVVEFEGTAKEYKKIDETTYFANKVTASNLKQNTTYYYQYYLNGEWSEASSFTTGEAGKFSFLYVGDPQIGASKGQVPTESESSQSAEIAARNDAFSWNKTLTAATKSHPEVNFMVSAGDQINNTGDDNGQECEYAGFLSPDAMSELPVAATIGNHDSKFANFQNHFNVPNAYTEEKNATAAGNDYYYSYGSALFIVLNTNNYNCADHEALIQKAIASHPKAAWRIVTFHQDIYGSGLDHSDSDGIVLRTQLTTMMDKYKIDVVLQGHDHTYSRSYLLTSDGKNHIAYTSENTKSEYTNIKDGNSTDANALASKEEFLKENRCYKISDKTQGTVTNPKGVLYMEANSSTGSKYYNLISTKQDYIANRSQTWTPTYSVIDVTKDSFTINTYDVNTGSKIDKAFVIKKTDSSKTSKIKVTKLTLNKKAVTVKVGKTKALKATIQPANATNKNIVFTSSKKKVATVDQKGVITGKKVGKATITAKAGTKKAVCSVTVKK